MRTLSAKVDCILINWDHPIKPTRVSYLSPVDLKYIMIACLDIGIRPNGKPKNPLPNQRGYSWAQKSHCLCADSIPMFAAQNEVLVTGIMCFLYAIYCDFLPLLLVKVRFCHLHLPK